MSKNVKKRIYIYGMYIYVYIYMYMCVYKLARKTIQLFHICAALHRKIRLERQPETAAKTQRSGTAWSRGNGSSITDEGKERYTEGMRDMYRNVCL